MHVIESIESDGVHAFRHRSVQLKRGFRSDYWNPENMNVHDN
jgi:hypothetical protein